MRGERRRTACYRRMLSAVALVPLFAEGYMYTYVTPSKWKRNIICPFLSENVYISPVNGETYRTIYNNNIYII
ncbi:hypothetical protein BI040_gp25 [Escherichia phage vB_EcoS_NBD2]|uniref:Uncharacterized protein n=1 Tax=Escherichia phage vB_EcoS_NBD2 TaxID=1852563 RepID=A0A192Y7X5_9CAUD|nr:hypothetical protein BI040_gp25 [Escherichia phage vB_EcoS_NBD2]ANM45929.1 hypothetical protein NBD2_87 [Escherichia phage vB_EcoS_NBD2]